jgi:putative transposase
MRPKRPRLPADRYQGPRAAFLTFCTSHRTPHFRSPEIVASVLGQLLRTATETQVEIAIYCFMPDHLHMLVEGGLNDSDAGRFVKLGKQRSGFIAKRTFYIKLWQPSYYDHVLRENEASQGVVRYILENPVRAGLSASVTEFPFTGSSKWTIHELLTSLELQCWTPPMVR